MDPTFSHMGTVTFESLRAGRVRAKPGSGRKVLDNFLHHDSIVDATITGKIRLIWYDRLWAISDGVVDRWVGNRTTIRI